MKRTLETRKPKSLKIHPENTKLYGNIAEPEFIAHVKKYGIISPLLITSDDRVIGGHRRRQAALNLKIEEVPVIVLREDLSEDDILLLLLADNRYRDKDNETRAREFQMLVEIEERKAKERQKTLNNKGGALKENVPEARGQSRDIAAEKVGMSGKTAEKAAKVVKAIDEAEEAGDTEKAEELRETLNKSVSAASKAVEDKPAREVLKDKAGNEIPDNLVETFEARPEFDVLCRQINAISKKVRELEDEGFPMRLQSIQADLRNARSAIKFAAPYAVCCYCKGKGRKGSGSCQACKGTCWIGELSYKNAPEEMK